MCDAPRKPGLGQRGFTFIELVIALAVAALLAGVVTETIYQVLTHNARGTSHMVAVKQVENALHFITRDVQMAQTIEFDSWPDPVMQLDWADWDDNHYTAKYYWDPATGLLDREFTTGGPSGDTTRISQYIASLSVDRPAPAEVRVTISSQVGNGLPETRTVQIYPRTGS